MDIESSTKVSFGIDPIQLTQLSRDISIEKGWQKGIEFLSQALEGITYSQAEKILKGECRLDGDKTGMDIVTEEASVFAQVQQRWSQKTNNCFEYEGSFWKAYAYVDGCSKKDYDFARNESAYPEQTCANLLYKRAFDELVDFKANISWRGLEEVILLRNMYYAFNKGSDLVLPVKQGSIEKFVLFQRVSLSVPADLSLTFERLELDWSLLEVRGDLQLQLCKEEKSPSIASVNVKEENNLSIAKNPLDILLVESTSNEYEEKKRQLVLDFAKNDTEYGIKMFRVKDRDTNQYVDLSVPYRAFLCLAYSRARLSHLMPEYSPFCPSGLKGHFMDSPYHTDAWLGAGGALDNAYDESLILQRVFMWKLHELQMEITQFGFSILCKGSEKTVRGIVETDPEYAGADKILVVKNAAPEYALAAVKCAAVICEIGSKIAHLVLVSAEEGTTVLRMDNAVNTFRQGQEIEINLQTGVITVI